MGRNGPEAADGIWTMGPINFALESKSINSAFLCFAQFKLTLLISRRAKNPKAINKVNQIRNSVVDKPIKTRKNFEFTYFISEISAQNNTISIKVIK